MGMIENIKEIAKIVNQAGNIELYQKVLDLQADALEQSERLQEKDKRIEQLEAAFSIKDKLKLKKSAYYITDDNEQLIDGPFCTKCFDVDKLKCRIVSMGGSSVQCLKCKLPFRAVGMEFFNT